MTDPCVERPRWERPFLGVVVLLSLALGFANLAKPALWHDELVHVYVAKAIGETGLPLLMSGRVFTNGALYNYLLAAVIMLFGDGEFAVRAPSVIFFAVNVFLVYRILREWIGWRAAMPAALLFALSPWSVAWARQARFYMLHQTVYLLTMYSIWRAGEADSRKDAVRWGLGACAGYGIGLLAGPQTIFFLAPAGAYAGLRWLQARSVSSRWLFIIAVCGVLGAGTLLGYYAMLPKAEHDAIFKEAQLLAAPRDPMADPDQSDSLYYFRFFTNNLSAGYFMLACIGLVLLPFKEGRRGLFVALCFLAPILVLNYLIGYRRHRFLFFAYPFYVAACAYAMVWLARFVKSSRRSMWRMAVSAAIVVFGVRLALSTFRLIEDTVAVAGGDDTTLANHHPQWRKPCEWVRDHRNGAAVLCTTYLTAHYYIGHVDNWYPSRVIVWEYIESGLDGLRDLDDLQAFIAEHPRGFFVAEWRRFGNWRFYQEDIDWVESNMRRIDEASSRDVTVYAWGLGVGENSS